MWSILDSESFEIFSYTLEDGEEGLSRIFTIETGEVEPCFGDLNNDDTLNILDVLIIINAILSEEWDDELSCGDMNSDEILNVLDVIILVDLILSE